MGDKKSKNVDAIFDAVVFVSLSFRTVAVYLESETSFDNCHPYMSISHSMQFFLSVYLWEQGSKMLQKDLDAPYVNRA